MKNSTMLEITTEIVSSQPGKSFTFNQIFSKVEEQLKDNWFKYVQGSNTLTYDQVRETKMGELHRLLTVDKRFHRNLDGTWKAA
ncbi:hypothetical protein BCF59_0015 [Mycoplasmopsis mustelae]|uniref:HTH HARE-type domain-containing protein n=1 Tax=Mycoplasmopsis mustelae TaxID=171289 RepID=A0A4R7UDS8_9BACT|nr:hypothetical protein [Mycoplasmopsis mustelae]TDV24071.1 hypothetical protein BCF59_0015 [Mycoplasmopsis mustelae]